MKPVHQFPAQTWTHEAMISCIFDAGCSETTLRRCSALVGGAVSAHSPCKIWSKHQWELHLHHLREVKEHEGAYNVQLSWVVMTDWVILSHALNCQKLCSVPRGQSSFALHPAAGTNHWRAQIAASPSHGDQLAMTTSPFASLCQLHHVEIVDSCINEIIEPYWNDYKLLM